MNKKKKILTRSEMQNKIIKALIFLGIALIVLVILNIIKNKEQKVENWSEENFGDIVLTETEEDVEEIPPNIFDAFGLEYEYTKIPSLGFSTYIPVGWEFLYQDDYLYFMSPKDGGDEMQQVEIAFCVTDVNNIKDKQELLLISEYAQKNLRNHCQNLPFVISTVTNNQYTELYDETKPVYIVKSSTSYNEYLEEPIDAKVYEKGYHLIGYYCNPLCQFVYEDNPIKSNWSPYAAFYQLNTNKTTTLFASIVGPRMYELQIEEIGKTIAYNTNEYENTKFDFNTFEKTKFKKRTIGDMFYRIKDEEDVEEETSNLYNLSTNPKSLGYNCRLSIKQDRLKVDLNDYFTEEIMTSLWLSSNEFANQEYTEFHRKESLTKPTYNILTKDTVQMFNKNCMKITWNVDMELSSNSRKYVNSIMPTLFNTYLIPDGNNVYIYTINYTVYQKYSAQKYIDRVLELSGFDK